MILFNPFHPVNIGDDVERLQSDIINVNEKKKAF